MTKYIEKNKLILYSFLTLSFYLPIGCSSSLEIQSSLNNNQIKIDGNNQDWGTSLNYLKDDDIAFGFKNDKENLYIAIVTSDRSKIMKILSLGLTVWVESDKDKIGIKYPLKSDPGEMRNMRVDQSNSNDDSRRSEMINDLIIKNNDLQVTNSDDLPLYTENAEKGPDFVGKMGYNNNQLTYELKIPLTNNNITNRVFDKEISDVNIDFNTGEFKRENTRSERGNGDAMGSGRRSGGEGRRMGRGGQGPQRDTMNFEPLKYSFDVTLSK